MAPQPPHPVCVCVHTFTHARASTRHRRFAFTRTYLLPPAGVRQIVQIELVIGHNRPQPAARRAEAPGEREEEGRGPQALREGQGWGEEQETVPEPPAQHLIGHIRERPPQALPEEEAGLFCGLLEAGVWGCLRGKAFLVGKRSVGLPISVSSGKRHEARKQASKPVYASHIHVRTFP